jgi:uncharacterized membrane protein YcjF (UPF0283 family)
MSDIFVSSSSSCDENPAAEWSPPENEKSEPVHFSAADADEDEEADASKPSILLSILLFVISTVLFGISVGIWCNTWEHLRSIFSG